MGVRGELRERGRTGERVIVCRGGSDILSVGNSTETLRATARMAPLLDAGGELEYGVQKLSDSEATKNGLMGIMVEAVFVGDRGCVCG